jgi:predicted AlkP superfamily pyrophosphatase or phosphodiesterase
MVTTTAQCFVHLLTGPYDLAAVPRWRRRRFEINKTRYMRRNADEFQRLNGVGTIFSALGKDDCSYVYSQRLDELSSLFLSLGSGERRLEFFEAHSMDTLQHWNLDDPSKIASSYHQVDRFVNALHATCESNGVRMMLLSDHGMELVTEFIDIIGGLKALGLRRDEYTFFVEAPKARFWAHTDRARRRITEMLSALDHGTFLSYQDLHRYNLKFEDARYGEFYFIADPGQIFFPHDYHHPLANLFMGLTHEHQRSRLQSPKYRGYHGYLPHHESEKGLLILLDDRYKFRQPEMSIIDVAPTILTVLGEKPPDHMKGRCVLEM